MANPFSAVATPFRVHTAQRWWFANCAWDAFGICAALHVDGRIETACADCGEAIRCEARGERPDDESLLFHFSCRRRGGGTTSCSPEPR